MVTCLGPRAFSPFPTFLKTNQTLSTPRPVFCWEFWSGLGWLLTVFGNFQNCEQMPTHRAKLEQAHSVPAGRMERRIDSPCWGKTRPRRLNRSSNLCGPSSLKVSNMTCFYPTCVRRRECLHDLQKPQGLAIVRKAYSKMPTRNDSCTYSSSVFKSSPNRWDCQVS